MCEQTCDNVGGNEGGQILRCPETCSEMYERNVASKWSVVRGAAHIKMCQGYAWFVTHFLHNEARSE